MKSRAAVDAAVARVPAQRRAAAAAAPGRVALVQEWVDAAAGSEKVFAAMAACFPEADLWALSERPGHGLDLGGRQVRTTVLGAPSLRGRRGLTLPLMPLAWRALGRDRYDWSLTSHHAFASSNVLAPAEHSLVYVHSPARYVWYPELDGRGGGRALAPARRLLGRLDRRAAQRPSAFAANSTEVRRRVQECWGRDARVVPPPVDTGFFARPARRSPSVAGVPGHHADGAVLFVGRWVSYKRPDLAVELGEALGRPVVLAGSGPLEADLRYRARAAGVPVHVCVRPSTEELRELYARAAFLVFLGHEDFGIVPVEAMAAGTPVLALDAGGARDTVVDGVSGWRVPDLRPGTLLDAARRCEQVDPRSCRTTAQRFSVAAFQQALLGWCRDEGMPVP